MATTEAHATVREESKKRKQKSVGWYLKSPIRALSRARDSYEKGLNGLARGGRMISYRSPGRGFAFPARGGGSEEDRLELMRAMAQRKLASTVVPRSQSAPAMGRIDEEEEGAVGSGSGGMAYPRSRSCAVATIFEDEIVEVGIWVG